MRWSCTSKQRIRIINIVIILLMMMLIIIIMIIIKILIIQLRLEDGGASITLEFKKDEHIDAFIKCINVRYHTNTHTHITHMLVPIHIFS